MKRMTGFLTLELLISLALGSLLLLLISKFFLSTQFFMAKINGRTTVQYHGILAMSIFRQELKKASYLGCAKERFQLPVQMFEKNTLELKKEIKAVMKNNTKAIKIREISSDKAKVLSVMQHGHELQIQDILPIQIGSQLIITQEQCAMEFTVTAVVKQKKTYLIKTVTDLSNYNSSAQVGLYENHYFYIGQAFYRNRQKQPVQSLFEKINEDAAQELIPGVSDLQAKWLPQMDVSQRPVLIISLLLNSVDGAGMKNKSYFYQDAWHKATDDKFYQAWESENLIAKDAFAS
jgi:Tfp pilus assembly protein PilW